MVAWGSKAEEDETLAWGFEVLAWGVEADGEKLKISLKPLIFLVPSR